MFNITQKHIFAKMILCFTQVENRAAKSKRLREFAFGVFHNNFSLPSEKDERTKHDNAAIAIQQAQVFIRIYNWWGYRNESQIVYNQ